MSDNEKPDYREILAPVDYLAKLGKQLGDQERLIVKGRVPFNGQLLQNDMLIAEAIAYLMGKIETLEKLVDELQGGAS